MVDNNEYETIDVKCPDCGTSIKVKRNPKEIKYRCHKCDASYGCDIRESR